MRLSGPGGLICLLLLAASTASAQEDGVVPVLSGVSLTHRVFAVGPAPTPTSAQRPARSPKRGTTLHYTLSEDAAVYVSIGRERLGLLRAGRCQPVTGARGRRLRRRRPGRRCVVLKPIAISPAAAWPAPIPSASPGGSAPTRFGRGAFGSR